ncbi:hypothetical protein [Rhodoferax sp. TS-BS-61-7]|uniref:hypothetical protein n=1 Tax=Rhodoferax sp. TS-BS-61-7 TaxID=2094194 RepID=UPI0011AFD659|nr:hypothetical protein [Rhodoferax sp. TS-BS-61-7]
MTKIKNRYQAESNFCKLFFEAGQTLNIPKYGESCHRGERSDFSAAVIRAMHQCEFDDPHFIGGPGAFIFAKSHTDVERIFRRAEPIAEELCKALEAIDPTKARDFRTRLMEINTWMLQAAE